MDVEVLFLGTSNAMPTAKRNHPSVLITYGGEKILVDCGEGTQRQLRIANENPCKITRLLITHLHGDHVLGIPGLLKTLEMSEYSRTLKIYGPAGTKRHFEYLEKLYYPFKIKHEIHESPSQVKEKEFMIEALSMQHGIHTLAYAFTIKDKRRIDKKKLAKLNVSNSPLLAKLQDNKSVTIDGKKLSPKTLTYLQKGKKIAIILDTLPNANTIKIAKNADLLICESTFSAQEEAVAADHKHLTSTQAATIAKKAKAQALVLTHISQRYEHQPQLLLHEAKTVFKNTSLAEEFKKIVIQ